MKHVSVPFLVLSALFLIQCSPIRDGIVLSPSDQPLSSEAFAVALMGDIPYSARQVALFRDLIKEVNKDKSVELVLHAGDIKGSGPCNNGVYHHRLHLFEQFTKPFIYSIGDNEWTDCHRPENGQYHPLKRLDYLRQTFFANPSQSLGGQPISLRSQSAVAGFESFVEHVVFSHKRIVFGTLHIVGSNNGLEPWVGYDPEDTVEHPRQERLQEYQEREKAVTHWLTEIFRLASTNKSSGVVLLIQANPQFELNPDDEDRAGFNSFITTLGDLSLQYGKPVLLTHGHIHYLWIDRPLFRITGEGQQEFVPTFTRIQTAGSPFVRWFKITIDPESQEVFHFVDPFIHKLDSIPW